MAEQAQATARALFGRRDAALPAGVAAENATALPASTAGGALPTTEVERARLEAGISSIDLLVLAGLADSRGAARRLVEQGGAYLNDARLENRTVTADDLRGGALLLRAGKKRYQRVVAT